VVVKTTGGPSADPADTQDQAAAPDRLEITSGSLSPPQQPAQVGQHTDDQHQPEPPAAAPAPLVLSVFGAPALRWRPDLAQPDDLHDLSGLAHRARGCRDRLQPIRVGYEMQ
jgi:hypothetical protein